MRFATFVFPQHRYEEVMKIFANIIGMVAYEEKRKSEEWEEWNGDGNAQKMYYVKVPLTNEEYVKVYNNKDFEFYLLVEVPLSLLQYYHQENLQNPHYTTEEKLQEQEEIMTKVLAQYQNSGEEDPMITLTQRTYSNFSLQV